MPTITVKLDRKRAAQLARWARVRKTTKSEIVRELIDTTRRIETADDLLEWLDAAEGQALGFEQA
jgi:predicted transcriptional regulator